MRERREIRLWSVLLWIAVWQLASMWLDSDILLVSPFRVLCRLGQLIWTASFWKTVGFTLSRIASGFFLAAASGVLLAAVASRYSRIRELLAPVMLAVRSVPVASFIILALIWFSSENLSVLISFLMVLPVIYVNVLGGIRCVDRQLLEMAQVFRIPKIRVVRYIYVPQVMPYFYTACSVSLGMCWKAGVAAEVIGMPKGSVGERLQQAKVYLDTPDLFAWTLVIVAASLVFEKAVLSVVRRAAGRCSVMRADGGK
ncbi:MAG: ABC transporter permease subunit [Lachnospiraceae bacterium]|jgi:NitT/TauT family transport system permease protein|nr:ABC transporter permease subunit [Lachnospiraceae bacterium]